MQMPNTQPDFRALLNEVADAAENHVSPYLGHEHAWGEFLDRIGAALDAEQQGPSDDDLRGIFYQHSDSGDDGPAWIESEQFIVAARAVLARYGAQP
jgi:hypothetical protein